MIEYCEHIKYEPDKRTYHTSATIFIPNDGEPHCGKCKSIVDVSHLTGSTVMRTANNSDAE